MNLRGKLFLLSILRLKFGLLEKSYDRDTCIIVIDSDVGQVGMIVDAVKEVCDLSEQQIEPPPHLGQDAMNNFVRGMGKPEGRVVVLVDVVAAFSAEHFTRLTENQPTSRAA